MPEIFHRHRSWSASQAIDRLEGRRANLADRVAQIEATLAALGEELASIRLFDAELVRLSEIERQNLDRRRAQIALKLDEAPVAVSDETGVRPERVPVAVVSAAVHTGSRRYDPRLRLFASLNPVGAGSPEPVRPSVFFDVEKEGSSHLIQALEVPGLLHAAIMNEKAQLGPAPLVQSVPSAVLSLPMSASYLDRVFSVEALEPLTDPAEVEAYVALLRTNDQV